MKEASADRNRWQGYRHVQPRCDIVDLAPCVALRELGADFDGVLTEPGSTPTWRR